MCQLLDGLPHIGIIPGQAEEVGAGAAADADRLGLYALDLLHRPAQRLHSLALLVGGLAAAGQLHRLHRDLGAGLLFEQVQYGGDIAQHRVHLVLRQDAAIEVEHVLTWDRVHVADGLQALGRFEGGTVWKEQWVLASVLPLQELLQEHDELGAHAHGVDPQVRPGGVDLLSGDRELQPEDVLLGYLHLVPTGRAMVGDEHDVAWLEDVLLKEELYALLAADLLIGNEHQPDPPFQLHAGVQ